jgi:hypothetical protein
MPPPKKGSQKGFPQLLKPKPMPKLGLPQPNMSEEEYQGFINGLAKPPRPMPMPILKPLLKPV